MREMTALFRANKEKAPLALLFELAAAARASDVKTWVEVTQEMTRRGVRA